MDRTLNRVISDNEISAMKKHKLTAKEYQNNLAPS
jgi:hypothetical protein